MGMTMNHQQHLALLRQLPQLIFRPQALAPVLLATLLAAEVVVILLVAEVLTRATLLAVVIQATPAAAVTLQEMAEADPATAATLLGKAGRTKAIRKNEIGPGATLPGPDAPEPKTP